jgi:hypothetical protein
MVMWEIFRKPRPQKVTNGRCEIERDGEVAYLEYSLSGNILELIIPKSLKNCVTWVLRPLSLRMRSTGRASTTSR